ncbi:MAG: tyrosinase family protein [Methylobacteriaceae bacterium]|nr:tyrosinase family protein [Methylobacteriaceae bacterium]
MTISRRTVILQGAVIGAGLISENLRGIEALAQGQPPERRSLQGLAWNDPIVATYRDAVGILKQRPATQKISWVNLCGVHGSDPDTYKFCPHGNWYFLPWHRAYIAMYERVIRDITNNQNFALPYWDWTSNPTMPDVFLHAKTPDGKNNPLFVNDRGFGATWKRTWPAAKPMPADVVGPTVLQQILASTDYEDFGTSRPDGQNNLDPSWVVGGGGVQGVLEGTAHNLVHNNIGGWMPSAVSPRDPIFFMHHCNIDRIWALWNSAGNANSSESLWTDMPFTDNFLNPDGSIYSPKVSDLFVPENLGYTYGLAAPAQTAAASPAIVSLQNKLTTLRTAPRNTDQNGIKTFTAAPAQNATATAAKPLTVALNVDPNLVEAVTRHRAVPSGFEALGMTAAREIRASGTRALVFLRDVAVTNPVDTQYRVFLDRPDLTPQTPATDPNYVGSFGVFVHGDKSGQHGHAKPSFVLDVTNAIQRVYGNAPPSDGRIKLQIQPVATRPNAGQVGTATPTRIEVTFVTS